MTSFFERTDSIDPRDQSCRDTEIAIIGAGLAGLISAYYLSKKGYTVDVFEARNRVGGRVHSVFIENLYGGESIAELGGQNITDGGNSTHFLELVKELGLQVVEDP